MVKKTFFFLSISSAIFLVGAEFTASVSQTQVHLSEIFSLNLTLKDTSPKEAPALIPLKKDFLIQSEHHSSSTTILNGKVSSAVTWKISLTPKIEGVVQIPSITVDTAEGSLSTQPITLQVVKGSKAPSSSEGAGLQITAQASNRSPYKNEPLIYTASLISKGPLYQVQAEKIEIEDAMVESLHEPKLEERVIGGVLQYVVEFTYLITPLKTGTLKIPPIAIQGAIPQKRKGQFSSFFNDDFDPFALLQGFEALKPFALMTEEIPIDVQPPLTEVTPWLTARSLTLEDLWPVDQTALRVGEPISRGFVIQAEGLKASQLPQLEDLQKQNSPFTVYSDKPEIEEKVVEGIIHSSRKEQYTLIPQEAGTWELPEISISWWDSVKKEKRTSTIARRSVQILPALNKAPPLREEIASTPAGTAAVEAPVSSAYPPLLLYGIIGTLIFFLTAALLWGLSLQRKIAALSKESSPKPIAPPKRATSPPLSAPPKEKKEKLPDLNPT